jgi:hypothetical protein
MVNCRKTGLLTITKTQFESLQSLFFEIGSVSSAFPLLTKTSSQSDVLPCRKHMSSLGMHKSGPGPSTPRLAGTRVRSISSSRIWVARAGLDLILSVCFFTSSCHCFKNSPVYMLDGFVFLQRFYSVYDTTNNRVGLATTQFTQATTN